MKEIKSVSLKKHLYRIQTTETVPECREGKTKVKQKYCSEGGKLKNKQEAKCLQNITPLLKLKYS